MINNNPSKLVGLLVEHEVELVLVGGMAVTSHGSALMTKDVDVVCSFSTENLIRLSKALSGLRPEHRMAQDKRPFVIENEKEAAGWKNIYLRTTLGQLDVLSEVKGVGDYEACLANSEELDLEEFKIRVLTIDALIDAKSAIGRPKDIHAVKELEAIKELRAQG